MVKPLGRNRGAWAYATKDPRRQLARAARWRWAKTHKSQLLRAFGGLTVAYLALAWSILRGNYPEWFLLLWVTLGMFAAWHAAIAFAYRDLFRLGVRHGRIDQRWRTLWKPLGRLSEDGLDATPANTTAIWVAPKGTPLPVMDNALRRARMEVPPLKRK